MTELRLLTIDERIANVESKLKRLKDQKEHLERCKDKTCKDCFHFPHDWKTQLPKREHFGCDFDIKLPWTNSKITWAHEPACLDFEERE